MLAVLFSPLVLAQGSTTGGGNTASTADNAKFGAKQSATKSDYMHIPGTARKPAEGMLLNSRPAKQVTGDVSTRKQLQPYEEKNPQGYVRMYPSGYPVQNLYGPQYPLQMWQRVFMFVWFVALLLLSALWF